MPAATSGRRGRRGCPGGGPPCARRRSRSTRAKGPRPVSPQRWSALIRGSQSCSDVRDVLAHRSAGGHRVGLHQVAPQTASERRQHDPLARLGVQDGGDGLPDELRCPRRTPGDRRRSVATGTAAHAHPLVDDVRHGIRLPGIRHRAVATASRGRGRYGPSHSGSRRRAAGRRGRQRRLDVRRIGRVDQVDHEGGRGERSAGRARASRCLRLGLRATSPRAWRLRTPASCGHVWSVRGGPAGAYRRRTAERVKRERRREAEAQGEHPPQLEDQHDDGQEQQEQEERHDEEQLERERADAAAARRCPARRPGMDLKSTGPSSEPGGVVIRSPPGPCCLPALGPRGAAGRAR